MNVVKIVKWAFWGIFWSLAGAYAAFWLYFTIFPVKPPDVFHGVKPDFGEGPKDMVMSYVQSSMMLGNTTYKASVGVSRYDSNQSDSWDYYFCWISKKHISKEFGERWHPFFDRWIPAEKVPADLWNKDVKEVVSYNANTREVNIDFGVTNFTCTLPPD